MLGRMPRIVLLFSVLAVVFAVSAATCGVARAGPDVLGGSPGWVRPVGPPNGPLDVVSGFDPPADPWGPGHRGVDLAAPAGAEVRAPGPGRITYAGLVAGRGVLVVDHGPLQSTYEPVTASVANGDVVRAGDPIGTLAAAGSHCAPATCLHWGARSNARYIDPLSLVAAAPGTVRLLPLGQRTVSGDAPDPPVLPGGARLAWPVAEPRVTSAFGMRTHPLTGVYKLHDGTDFGAACGTGVHAAAAGRVTDVGDRGAYGLQVTVDHGRVGGVPVTTSYSHLARAAVTAGDTVASGRTIGLVGTSGSSTGCHLHFMVYADGQVVDPMLWLPGTPAGEPERAKHAGVARSPVTRVGGLAGRPAAAGRRRRECRSASCPARRGPAAPARCAGPRRLRADGSRPYAEARAGLRRARPARHAAAGERWRAPHAARAGPPGHRRTTPLRPPTAPAAGVPCAATHPGRSAPAHRRARFVPAGPYRRRGPPGARRRCRRRRDRRARPRGSRWRRATRATHGRADRRGRRWRRRPLRRRAGSTPRRPAGPQAALDAPVARRAAPPRPRPASRRGAPTPGTPGPPTPGAPTSHAIALACAVLPASYAAPRGQARRRRSCRAAPGASSSSSRRRRRRAPCARIGRVQHRDTGRTPPRPMPEQAADRRLGSPQAHSAAHERPGQGPPRGSR